MTAKSTRLTKPYLKKVRGIMDLLTGDWTYEFEFVRQDAKKGRALVPGDKADTPNTLARRLTKKGARLPHKSQERSAFLENVIQATPEKIVHQPSTAGWQDHNTDKPWMSVGERLIGAPTGTLEFAPPALMARSDIKAFGQSGSLEDWKSRVAVPATYSTCMMVCIAAGFAAPLLAFVQILNFNLHISGPSRSGKTTALLCGTSVAGTGREEDLPTWNSSGAHLLEAATAFDDLLYPLNEVGSARGSRKNVYDNLRPLHMQYADGRDHGRHSTWNGGQGGAPQRFRGISIATAEHSVAWYATAAGQKRDDGELFRAIDIPAIRGQANSIFDAAPEGVDPQVLLPELRTALSECHGTALTAYVEYLQSLGQTEIERLTWKMINHFVRRMPGVEQNGVARQIATNLGVLYAGCYFATIANILTWTQAQIMNALTRAFTDAVEGSKVADPLDLGLDILKKKLAMHVIERKIGSRFGVKEQAGYWTVEGGVKRYVVHTHQFGSWFPAKGLRDVVLNWLCAEGLLTQASGSTPGVLSPEDVKGLTPFWPHGKRVRSFVFTDPFSSNSASLRSPAVSADEDRAPTEADPLDAEDNPFERAVGGAFDPEELVAIEAEEAAAICALAQLASHPPHSNVTSPRKDGRRSHGQCPMLLRRSFPEVARNVKADPDYAVASARVYG